MDLKLLQSDVAKIFNVNTDCVTYWENNRCLYLNGEISLICPTFLLYDRYLPHIFTYSKVLTDLESSKFELGKRKKNIIL